MNYEEKYKNALEKLQEAFASAKDGCKISGLTRGYIENIFPELQESVDEKMKRAIMYILYENYTDAAVIEGVEIAEIATWLEEQSKKKSADEVLKIRQELYQSGYNDGYKHGQEDMTNKESDDELTRKGIIELVKQSSEILDKQNQNNMIAWLEKQGFNKEQTNLPCFTFDDVLALQCCMETVKKVQEDKELYEKLNDLHSKVYDACQFKKQGKQKQTWKPSIAQKIVIKELIEDKNTSNVHKTILRGMLDEFKQFTNNYKREIDNYEVEDSSQT